MSEIKRVKIEYTDGKTVEVEPWQCDAYYDRDMRRSKIIISLIKENKKLDWYS